MKVPSIACLLSLLIFAASCSTQKRLLYPASAFSKALVKPGTRILEEEDWFVWDSSPIIGEDGKIHVFFHGGPMNSAIGYLIPK